MGNTLKTPPSVHQEDRNPDQEMQPPPTRSENQNPEEEYFTCEICIEPASKKSQIRGDLCSHPFCTDCMIKYIVSKLEYGAAGARIKCPALACDRTLDPRAWAPLVGPSIFDRWCDALCEDAIGDLSRCHCPHADCNALIVSECGGGGGETKSKCPDCGRWFCFGCGRGWHAGFGCDESRDQNDVVFGRLAERMKWMRCPACRHFVELAAGCTSVMCRCGMRFCFVCGKRINRCSCRWDITNYTNCQLVETVCIFLGLFMMLLFVIVLMVLGVTYPKALS